MALSLIFRKFDKMFKKAICFVSFFIGASLVASDMIEMSKFVAMHEITLGRTHRTLHQLPTDDQAQESSSSCMEKNCSSTCSILQNSLSQGSQRCKAMSKDEKCCCAGITTFVGLGVLITILAAGTHDMSYNNYHLNNKTLKTVKLHFRGNGFNDCSEQICHTNSKGEKKCNQVPVDCIRVLYPQDRTTIRNYGHLSKLGARYYNSDYGYEYGSYEHVTDKGLKSLNWVLHNHKGHPIFTRVQDQSSIDNNQTHVDIYESFKTYEQNEFAYNSTLAANAQALDRNLRGFISQE